MADYLRAWLVELADRTVIKVRGNRLVVTESGAHYFTGPDEVVIGVKGLPLAPRPGLIIKTFLPGELRRVELLDDPYDNPHLLSLPMPVEPPMPRLG